MSVIAFVYSIQVLLGIILLFLVRFVNVRDEGSYGVRYNSFMDGTFYYSLKCSSYVKRTNKMKVHELCKVLFFIALPPAMWLLTLAAISTLISIFLTNSSKIWDKELL